MTFPEIFEQFKSHSYIRRKSWPKDVFVQLKHTEKKIRVVVIKVGKTPDPLSNETQLRIEDLLGDDWVDIGDLWPK